MARILVIDDEPAVRMLLEQWLRSAGHRVFLAADGAQALAHLRATSADLVITDLYMPNKDGVETIITIRQLFPSVRVIAMSGNPKAENMLSVAQKLGVAATIQKPFLAEELCSLVETTLKAKTPMV